MLTIVSHLIILSLPLLVRALSLCMSLDRARVRSLAPSRPLSRSHFLFYVKVGLPVSAR